MFDSFPRFSLALAASVLFLGQAHAHKEFSLDPSANPFSALPSVLKSGEKLGYVSDDEGYGSDKDLNDEKPLSTKMQNALKTFRKQHVPLQALTDDQKALNLLIDKGYNPKNVHDLPPLGSGAALDKDALKKIQAETKVSLGIVPSKTGNHLTFLKPTVSDRTNWEKFQDQTANFFQNSGRSVQESSLWLWDHAAVPAARAVEGGASWTYRTGLPTLWNKVLYPSGRWVFGTALPFTAQEIVYPAARWTCFTAVPWTAKTIFQGIKETCLAGYSFARKHQENRSAP